MMQKIRVVAYMLIAFASFQIKAMAQTSSPSQQAIYDLKNMPARTSALNQQIQALNVIPPYIWTDCTYCTYAWGSLCFHHASVQYMWSFTDFKIYSQTMQSQNATFTSDLNQFSNSYGVLADWFLNTLPSISNQLSRISATDPAPLVQMEIQISVKLIDSATSQLQNGVQQLDNWFGKVMTDANNITATSGQFQNCIAADKVNFQNYASSRSCGQGSLYSQWNTATTNTSNALNNYMSQINSFGVSAQDLNNDFKVVFGEMVTLQDKMSGIATQLQNASISSNTAVQMVQTAAAEQNLNQLITLAQTELVP